MSIFAVRHYEWLARFAGEHLNNHIREELAAALMAENDKFKRERFLIACHEHGLAFDYDLHAKKTVDKKAGNKA